MSARPRWAGEGRLRLPEPEGVRFAEAGGPERIRAVGARLGEDTYEPFERVGADLLLAEAFARLDLAPSDALLAWFGRHGVLALEATLPSEASRRIGTFTGQLQDRLADIAVQQANVRWHLESIAHLSDHLVPQPGTSEGVPWQERWAQPVLAVGDGYRWLGAEDWFERDLLAGMERSGKPPAGRHPALSEDEWIEWWRRGHESWRRIVAERVPVVRHVSDVGTVGGGRPEVQELVASDLTEGIGTGPWDLVELENRLMAPYIAVAAAHRVEVGWSDEPEASRVPPLLVRERRTWDSLLAPVYVQLLEGLLRVSEGQRGAAFCKECGQPFLTLDARRSAFCNDRERYRHGQREHRKRLRGDATPDEAKE